MSLLTIILVLIIAGVLLWAINAIIPMEPTIKKVLNVVVIAVVVLWVVFSLFGGGSVAPVGAVHLPKIC